MPECFALELGMDWIEGQRYKLRFLFLRPGDAVESSLGLVAPVSVTIDEESLFQVAGEPQEYGQRLACMLFADPQARLAFTRARTAAAGRPLRLRLSIDPVATRLHNIRWETLYDLDRNLALSTDENVHFSRAMSSASTERFDPPISSQLRALVFIANPRSKALEPVDVPSELARAKAGLAGMVITSLAGQGQATLDHLLDQLHEGCDILYLVAHGLQTDPPRLFFETDDGEVDPVEVPVLLERLRGLSSRKLPLLTVLVSCESAGDPHVENPLLALGPRLLADVGIPAVLAMHGRVTYLTMEKFLPVFFKELQRDGQIDRAMAVARARVLDRPDWWMPVLFSRLRDNRLLQPPPQARPLELKFFEPETVYIPAGPFLMGSDPGPGVSPAEMPLNSVDLPAYRIGKTPVTNGQYAEFVRQTGQSVNPEAGWEGQSPPRDRLDYPVIGVTWYQAIAYCDWLSQVTGRKYSLPNEAQWEKAARGVDGWRYPWGDSWQEGRCNSDPNRICPVDEFPYPGPFGCLDMVGNAREWTLSLWGERRTEQDPRYAYPWKDDGRNDPGAGPLVRRVYRGGAASIPEEMTCSARNAYAPDKSGPPGKRHGFRVVLMES